MNTAQDSIASDQYKLLQQEGQQGQTYPFDIQEEWFRQKETDSISTTEHPSLPPSDIRNENTGEWATVLLLLCFAIYAWVRYFHARRLNHIHKALMARHLSNMMIREGNLFRERISLPLQAMSLLSISYFVFLSLTYSSLMPWLTSSGLEGFARIILAVSALWLIKLVLVRTTGFLFKTNTSAYIYNLNMLVYLTAAGIVLLPINVIATYLTSGTMIYVGLLSLALIYFLWIIRGISVGLDEKRFSVFHLFLYLCTFEILPVLILLKLVFKSN